jgi:hypothetical protein
MLQGDGLKLVFCPRRLLCVALFKRVRATWLELRGVASQASFTPFALLYIFAKLFQIGTAHFAKPDFGRSHTAERYNRQNQHNQTENPHLYPAPHLRNSLNAGSLNRISRIFMAYS